MQVKTYLGTAIGLAMALGVSTSSIASAQTDTTRRTTSEQRIPIRKDGTTAQGTRKITRMESGGEVVTLPVAVARVDALEAAADAYRRRIDALEAANASLSTRSAATDRMILILSDSLRMVRGDLAVARTELSALRGDLSLATARTTVLADSLRWLNRRFASFRNGSVFGHSGLFVGIGTGMNVTTGDLRNLGYASASHVEIPIGWAKRGNLIGIRTQWAMQRLEGRMRGSFTNPDPEIKSGVAMLTLNFPLNQGKTNTFYVMGGGGAYQFHHVGATSSLTDAFPGIIGDAKSDTKWGMTGGAGLEFHMVGASSFFVQSAFTSVSATGRRLNWVPIVTGLTLR